MEHMFLQHSGNCVGVRLHPISQLGSLVFPCDCEPPSCFWQDTSSCGRDRHLVTEFPIMEKLHLRVSDLKYRLHLNSTAIAKQFAYEVAGQSGQNVYIVWNYDSQSIQISSFNKMQLFYLKIGFFQLFGIIGRWVRKPVGVYWYQNLDREELLGYSSFEFATLKIFCLPVFKNHLATMTHSFHSSAFKIPLYYEFISCIFHIAKSVFCTGVQVDEIGTTFFVLLKCSFTMPVL